MSHNAPRTLTRKRGNAMATLPTRFCPRFWAGADRRVAMVREIESRVERLKADCGADSMQKEVLAERAVFLISVLETAELNALDGTKSLDVGGYTQGLNALQGLLRALGLEKKAKKIGLAQYVEERRA